MPIDLLSPVTTDWFGDHIIRAQVTMDTTSGLPASLPDLFRKFGICNKGTAQGDVIGIATVDNFLHCGGICNSPDQKNRNVYCSLDGPGAFPVEGLSELGRFYQLFAKAPHHEAKQRILFLYPFAG